MPITDWPQCADHAVAPLCRSSTGSNVPVGDTALTYYVGDGRVPIDNNWIENQIRPIALGRKNWLFAGSEEGGRTAATILA